MRVFLFTAVAGSMVLSSYAMCAQQCNGHGVCTRHDRCICYPNWQGYSCADRVCPFAKAWADAPYDHNAAHDYAECANRGICDRSTGECQCFEGYEGESCRRMACPNACSGHGQCETTYKHGELTDLGEFFGDAGAVIDKGVQRGLFAYSGWDKDMTQSCKCDAGYTGVDCASRLCPRGNDPLTTEDKDGLTEVQEIQQITVGDNHADLRNGGTPSGFFTISFTDSFGHTWETRPIPAADHDDNEYGATSSGLLSTGHLTTQDHIKHALMALPNDVIHDVEVTKAVSGNLLKYLVTFTSHANTGKRNRLKCNFVGCNTDGCQPRYAGITSTGTPTCIVTGYTNTHVSDTAVTTAGGTAASFNNVHATMKDGTGEDGECSNRGLCNREEGLCECFEGYTGESCSVQTILV